MIKNETFMFPMKLQFTPIMRQISFKNKSWGVVKKDLISMLHRFESYC